MLTPRRVSKPNEGKECRTASARGVGKTRRSRRKQNEKDAGDDGRDSSYHPQDPERPVGGRKKKSLAPLMP